MRSAALRSAVLALSLALLAAAAACGKDAAPSKPPPEAPYTGAPVAVIVDKLEKDTASLSLYNFSDKKVAGYWLLFRYYDKDGKLLRVKVGTPFESDHDFMTLTGNKFLCKPKAWCSFEVDHLEIPEGAVRGESLVRTVRAVAADGFHMEEEPLWELDSMEWPEKK